MSRRKSERLLDLIGFFLSQTYPVSKQEVFSAIPDYRKKLTSKNTDKAALERMFERDKKELLRLGIPLKFFSPADLGDLWRFVKGGYVLNKDEYRLPRIDLTAEEFLVLSVSTQIAAKTETFPFKEAAFSALQKLGLDLPAEEAAISTPPIEFSLLSHKINKKMKRNLEVINKSLLSRKWVKMTYYSLGRDKLTQRKVEPYGLVLKDGTWYLVGFCHLKSEVRVFNLNRVEKLLVNTKSPKSPDFEVPQDFDVRSYVSEQPWELWEEKRTQVKVRFDPKIAWWVKERFGSRGVFEEMGDGSGVLTLQVGRPDAFLRWVLTFKERAWIAEPDWLREDFLSTVERILERHR